MSFDRMNETAVREEIISPLLREMGYSSGSENNIEYEFSLRYPRFYLGRKDAKKDDYIRGRADYILQVGKEISWVIEAKPPTVDISLDDVQQAFTYAGHPEVRAVYFVLCNGRQLKIYQTNRGPEAGPIYSISYEQLQESRTKEILFNILSPLALRRDFPARDLHIGPPIGPGLRSSVQINGGHIRYSESSLDFPSFLQMQIAITGGLVERSHDNSLVAYVESQAPVQAIDDFLAKMNLKTIELVSTDTRLSESSTAPTVFHYRKTVIFPAGETLVDINTWQTQVLPEDIRIIMQSTVSGFLEGNIFSGVIENNATFSSNSASDEIPFRFKGNFLLQLRTD